MITDFSEPLKLGLVGDNIASSRAPQLHVTAGRLSGLDVTYERLVPRDLGKTFGEVFEFAKRSGFAGLNITYPYKEQVVARVTIDDPHVRTMGAVNTVVFTADGPRGYNTDHSGFVQAYRHVLAGTLPGTVCLIGSGGAGKAVAVGLADLKAKVIRCVDLDAHKAQALADRLVSLDSDTSVEVFTDAVAAARGADGLVNCTPVGMTGLEGTPLIADAMNGASWAFDAIYTPVETQFLKDAESAGLAVMSGYELFLGQGVDAWHIFTGLPLNRDDLRTAISGGPE